MKRLFVIAALIVSSSSAFAVNRLDLEIGGQIVVEANTVTHVTCGAGQQQTSACSLRNSGGNINLFNGANFVKAYQGMSSALEGVRLMNEAGLCGVSSCTLRNSGGNYNIFQGEIFVQSFQSLTSAVGAAKEMRDAGLCR